MKRREGETEAEFNARHSEKMAAKKAAHDRKVAARQEERGLLIVHTGSGKGKSTAAFGLVLRSLGNDKRVAVVQFVKGAWRTGERPVLESLAKLFKGEKGDARIALHAMGEGFTWETQDRARDIATAEEAWAKALEFLRSSDWDLVLLDELNIVLRYGYLDAEQVVKGLAERSEGSHAVVTGRNAPEVLIEAADLVTEMTLIKHPFRAGVKAQAGIEF